VAAWRNGRAVEEGIELWFEVHLTRPFFVL
jgi:hypothetical protein